jgi:hypothetical protein
VRENPLAPTLEQMARLLAALAAEATGATPD